MARIAVLLVLLCASAFAAKKTDVTVQVLGSDQGVIGGGTQTTANANCSATSYSANCNGTSTTMPIGFQYLSIAVQIDGQQANLVCDGRWHWTCINLRPGTYKAQIKGNTIWVDTYNFDHSKKKVVKYAIK